MMPKIAVAISLAAILSTSSISATAAPAAALFVQAPSQTQKVTFWGRPFPYGYNWSLVRACTRYEPVESASGRTHWQRVWVCSVPRRYSYY